jgi:RNase adapter protein RapZ
MKLILITGMSGAGKSLALKSLEDCGFEAIDNIPLAFLPTVVASGAGGRNLVVGSDIRSRDFSAEHFLATVTLLRGNAGLDFSMLFLDSEDEVLRRRFTETRRRHPLAQDRPVLDGIHHERQLLHPLREAADLMVDTSEYEASELRKIITGHFAPEQRHLSIVLKSFSFKTGIPRDADMVFDVRFLKNPHYDPVLQHFTGLDPRVGAYIESDSDFASFYQRLTGMLMPLMPRYLEEGKNYLTIAIGCTGGKHRSVHVVQKLGAFLIGNGYKVSIRHRDIEQN